jgi:outer membrane protein
MNIINRLRRILTMAGFLLLLIPLLSGSQGVLAQNSWSLQDCIKYALANNIQIKQQRLNLDLQSDDLLMSKAALLPNINGNASHSYNFGRTVDRFTNTFATERVQTDNFYLSSSVTVFNGFRLLNTVAKNRLNLQAGKYDVEKMQNDVSLNIASAYLNILFNQEILAIAQNQADITKQQVDRTRKLVDAGTVAKGNLLSIEAQASAEDLNVVTSQNRLDLSYLLLVQILDLKTTEGFDILKPKFTVPEKPELTANADQVFNLALPSQPQVKSAELKLESSMKDLSISRASYYPSLSLQGSYGTGFSDARQQMSAMAPYTTTIGYAKVPGITDPVPVTATDYLVSYEKIPFDNQINDNLSKSFGFYLNIPIFNGLQVRNATSRAKIGIESSRLSLQLTKQQLRQDIQQAFADTYAAIRKYHAAKVSSDAMQEAFFYTEQKFNVGMVNSVDYNDAKKNLTKAQSDLLQAKYEYVFKKTVLDFYMGKPIALD